MKHFIGTILVFVGSLLAVSGQITEQEINELLNSREIQLDNPIIQNLAVIRQVQDENRIISVQEQQGNVSNQVLVNQDGTGNQGYIEQTGWGLETHLWQYNSNNVANVRSEGNNISTSVKQKGDENVINSYIENYDLEKRSAMLLQEGNKNRINLDLRETGVPETFDSQEFRITQNGNGHEATVTGDDFNSPITIDQTAGSDGTGMKIEINTSYFSFPTGN